MSSSSPFPTHPPSQSLRPLSAWLEDCATELGTEQVTPARDAAARHAMQLSLQCRPKAARQPWWRRLFSREPAAAGGKRASWAAPLAWSGAGACGLLLVAASALLLLEPPPSADQTAYATDFVPLVPPDRWASYLQETGQARAWLVSTELPRDRLALMGLPYDPSQAGERVKAELLMHPSGDLLAVRFVR
ncbi:hypothetical protein [Pelomonas sp. SE-A7]|uniref:hypothetical protein n=1 Tax=Pelomonas sp. SE-A7 TaxID=3054953 RepID=UPI00259C69E7|nr:hypothetical protein [Pelomonas sp. SE-A7]MDM4766514.1 hypothetical protein [Pelomonas sp. SE-A7]